MIFEIRHDNGRFKTREYASRKEAVALAAFDAGAPEGTSQKDLRAHWGVRVTKLSRAEAEARGFH